MTRPRLSIEALATRLYLEREILVTVVEGFNDKRLLGDWADEQGISADIYSSDDIEIEIKECLEEVGGNKARVISLFIDEALTEFADKNLIGVVDRDMDFELGKTIDCVGLYYTSGSCLMTRAVSRDALLYLVNRIFLRDLPNKTLEEIASFSWKYFHLRVKKQEISPNKALPSIKKSVRSLKDGGFNWERYNRAVLNETEIKRENLADIPQYDVSRASEAIHLHSTLEYTLYFLQKERILPSSTTIDELYRHARSFYIGTIAECDIAMLITRKAAALAA